MTKKPTIPDKWFMDSPAEATAWERRTPQRNVVFHAEDSTEEVGRFIFRDSVLVFEGDAAATMECLVRFPVSTLMGIARLIDDELTSVR